jgi:hypothetical protein
MAGGAPNAWVKRPPLALRRPFFHIFSPLCEASLSGPLAAAKSLLCSERLHTGTHQKRTMIMKTILSALFAVSVLASVAAPASAEWNPKQQKDFWEQTVNF